MGRYKTGRKGWYKVLPKRAKVIPHKTSERIELKVNKRERYKRVHSKGRYTILKPKSIEELHQMDYVGPRHIKGYGPINSLHLKDIVGRQVAGQQYNGKSMDNVMGFLLDYWKCVGIKVVFIAPSKPWMNGTIEEFNKGFDKRFWQKELFVDLNDIRKKSKTFFETENKFNLI